MRLPLLFIGLIASSWSTALEPEAVVCHALYSTLASRLRDASPTEVVALVHSVIPNHRITEEQIADRIEAAFDIGIRTCLEHTYARLWVLDPRPGQLPLTVERQFWAAVCARPLVEHVSPAPCFRRIGDLVVWQLTDATYRVVFGQFSDVCAANMYSDPSASQSTEE